MAVTVGTDSYVTEAELTAYATARGITLVTDLSVLLTKSLDYIDTRSYIGTKTDSTQAMQWPRVLCGSLGSNYYALNSYPSGYTYLTSCEYDSETVPTEIKNAQMIGAILIDGGNDLQPVIGQSVKREKIDVIEVEYQDGSTTGSSQFRALNDILRPFIKSSISGTRV
jgi:hypothetical protein